MNKQKDRQVLKNYNSFKQRSTAGTKFYQKKNKKLENIDFDKIMGRPPKVSMK